MFTTNEYLFGILLILCLVTGPVGWAVLIVFGVKAWQKQRAARPAAAPRPIRPRRPTDPRDRVLALLCVLLICLVAVSFAMVHP